MRTGWTPLPREVRVLLVGTLVNRAGTFVQPFLVLHPTIERGFSASQAGLVGGKRSRPGYASSIARGRTLRAVRILTSPSSGVRSVSSSSNTSGRHSVAPQSSQSPDRTSAAAPVALTRRDPRAVPGDVTAGQQGHRSAVTLERANESHVTRAC